MLKATWTFSCKAVKEHGNSAADGRWLKTENCWLAAALHTTYLQGWLPCSPTLPLHSFRASGPWCCPAPPLKGRHPLLTCQGTTAQATASGMKPRCVP